MNNKCLNLKAKLIDRNNHELVILGDNKNTLSCEQIARIHSGKNDFYILYPHAPIDMCGDNDAFIYRWVEEEFQIITDKDLILKIFTQYYKLLRGEYINKQSYLKVKANVYTPAYCNMDDEADYTRFYLDCENFKSLKFAANKLVGQEHVVEKVCRYLYTIEKTPNKRGPKGVMLFMGAPGVGKTFFAELLSDYYNRPVIVLYMSGYGDREQIHSWSGIHKSYKDARSGDFTGPIDKSPIIIVVGDEIEKAHVTLLQQLLQVLDQGTIRDPYLERDIDLCECLLIFTTNVGKSIYDGNYSKYNFADVPKEILVNALKSELNPQTGKAYFSDALVSRFSEGEIVMFNKLTPNAIKKIIISEINYYIDLYQKVDSIHFDIDADALASMLIFKNANSLDIRNLKKEVKDFFAKLDTRKNEYICSGNSLIPPKKLKCDFNYIDHNEEIGQFLHPMEKRKVLCCGKKSKLNNCLGFDLNFVSYEDFALGNEGGACYQIESVLIDATDNLAESEIVLDKIKDRLDCPIYVYSKTPTPKTEFHYFLENGADECYSPLFSVESFEEWVKKILLSVSFNATTNLLSKKGKCFDYREKYSFDKNSGTFFVSIDAYLSDAFERLENGKIINTTVESKKKIACHEAGHVMVGSVLLGIPASVTILSRGNYGGYVQNETANHLTYTKEEIRNIICQCLAGRVAEVITYGENGITTGASQDFSKATALAKNYYSKYGMGENIATIDEETPELRAKIESLLQEEYKRAEEILREHADILEKIISNLLQHNTLTKEEITQIIKEEKHEFNGNN